jgi:gamma-glutamylcyclotransferase
VLYFAYGSNMLTERLQDRVPSAEPVAAATLPGRTLRFHKRSKDGSGKCNLAPAPEDSAAVHGVLFDFASDDLSALDDAEHRGHGYERRRVHPQTPDGSVDAFAYVAQPAYVDDALRPYDWYRAIVTAGAYQHRLPTAYRTRIEATRSYPDPDTERRRRYRSLLRRAGFMHLWPE